MTGKNEECFNGVLSGFQRNLKEAQWLFGGSFKGIRRKFQGLFNKDLGFFERPLSLIQENLKGI